jgi:hypothetical protein
MSHRLPAGAGPRPALVCRLLDAALLHHRPDGSAAADELGVVAVDIVVLAIDQVPDHALGGVGPRSDKVHDGVCERALQRGEAGGVPRAGSLCDLEQLLVHRLLALQRGRQQQRDGPLDQQLKGLLGHQQVACRGKEEGWVRGRAV